MTSRDMDEFAAAIHDEFTRAYGATMDHAIWCGDDPDLDAWKTCTRCVEHERAGAETVIEFAKLRAEQS